ncbi:MAG: YdcH family protein [Rhodobacteraceae bacterium]|nr:YdcH family protein [Paracoccaceae bacterium]MCB1344465.1 YdcH family protein [Paracoccaceae bacterium]
MSNNAHLEELRRKHRILSARVEEAQRSPGIDDLQIARLKKEKLHIKEEIYRLSGVETSAAQGA